MAKKPVQSVKTMDETQKATLYADISAWHAAKAKMAEWTSKERELRDAIVAKYFPEGTEGTNTMNLDFGKALKANITVSRGVDKAQLEAMKTSEDAKLAADPEYKSNLMPLLDEVVKYRPEVSTSGWKELSAESRLLLADVVTEKPGAPSLSIETPKT